MAFLETYRTLVQRARDERRPVTWEFSPGTSKADQERALLEAVELGRISAERAQILLPHKDATFDERVQKLIGTRA